SNVPAMRRLIGAQRVMKQICRLQLIITALTLIVYSAALFGNAMAQQAPMNSQKDSGNMQGKVNTDSVSIAGLAQAALEAIPEIVAMRRDFDAALARVPQAKALPDPMLMFGHVNVGSPI